MVHSRRKISSVVGVGDVLSYCISEAPNHTVGCVGYGPPANTSSLFQNAGPALIARRIVDG